MLGVMATRDAQRMAESQGLDLVEITPNAVPPVCKIMDYGKFKYEESIRAKQQRKAQKSTQVKEISPGISLEGMMLKLKLQYFGHLMRRVDSLKKTQMLGGIGGRRRRGRQRMRWLDGITDIPSR